MGHLMVCHVSPLRFCSYFSLSNGYETGGSLRPPDPLLLPPGLSASPRFFKAALAALQRLFIINDYKRFPFALLLLLPAHVEFRNGFPIPPRPSASLHPPPLNKPFFPIESFNLYSLVFLNAVMFSQPGG